MNNKKIAFLMLQMAFVFGLLTSCASFDPANPALQPSGDSVAISKVMKKYIRPVESSLDLNAINHDELISKSGVKNHSTEDFYKSKSIINIKLLFEEFSKVLKEKGEAEKAAALHKLSTLVTPEKVFKRPVHQFRINGELSNRVVFYGGDNELENGPGHRDLDKLAHDLDMPLVKVMTEFSKAQGGHIHHTIEGRGGAGHVGGYYKGWYKGKPVAVRPDWPFDYGMLDDDNRYYNAHILAIDYQAGTQEHIPSWVLREYHKNFGLWDVFSGLIVPFVTKSKYTEYQDYTSNPLEMYNKKTMDDVATKTASLDKNILNFTSYCSEGIWNVSNLAVNKLIKKGQYSQYDDLISTFQAAPKYRQMSLSEQRKNPQIGWEWLLEKELITYEQYQGILLAGRNAFYLDWVKDDAEAWEVYRPYNRNNFIGTPMNLGHMIRMLFRSYFPREVVANTISEEIKNIYKSGAKSEQMLVEKLLSGRSPNSMLGNYELKMLAMYMASGTLSYVLNKQEIKEQILNKLGAEHITEIEDIEIVHNLYDEYLQAIMNPKLFEREKFDQKISSLEKKLESLKVKMKVYGPNDVDIRTSEAIVPFFIWVPPQGYLYWAQYPTMYQSQTIKYVATAHHYEHSKQYVIEQNQ